MTKQEALNIVLNCSKMYHENLENKNILFIYENKHSDFNYIETEFLPRNFLHLTGLNILRDEIKPAQNFYLVCLTNNLSTTDFEFKLNGTTQKKLEILSSIMQIDKKARIIGNYNSQKAYLSTEKLIGSVNMCLGFVKENNYYIANTALKEDIRNIVEEQRRIVLVLKKNIKDKKYNEIVYKSKDIGDSEINKILVIIELNNKLKNNGDN